MYSLLGSLGSVLAMTVVVATASPVFATETLSEPLAEANGPLRLEEVLSSASTYFPLLLAAELERDVRQAELVSAFGDFDTKLKIDGDLRPVGFYESTRAGAGLEQRTRLWGARLDAGYRYGGGDFASYDGGKLTDEAGEVRGGLTVPLLRGGAIDSSRARLRRGELAAERVEPEIELMRIRTLRDAAVAYWDWVAAGLRKTIDARLLEVSIDRQDQIKGRVERGAEPRIDLVDNERLIVDRRVRLRAAQRDLELAAIRLSLYLRDSKGRPRPVHEATSPGAFPAEVELDPGRFAEDIEHVRAHHPLLRKMALDRERLEVDAKLARNDGLPSVDFNVQVSQDFGDSSPGIDTTGKLSPDPRGETEFKALIRFEMPVQRREARGRLAVAKARISQLEQRMQFESDRVIATMQSALAGLEAAFDQTGEARRNLALAEQMRLAEERKFSLGLSDLIDVNIREIQAAAAARGLVDARAAYFRALAIYEAAVARTAS